MSELKIKHKTGVFGHLGVPEIARIRPFPEAVVHFRSPETSRDAQALRGDWSAK